MDPIVMIHRLVIQIKLFIPAFNDVTGHPDNPLDKIFVRVHRIFEYNDIVSLGRFESNDGFVPVGYLNAINKFADQNVITD